MPQLTKIELVHRWLTLIDHFGHHYISKKVNFRKISEVRQELEQQLQRELEHARPPQNT